MQRDKEFERLLAETRKEILPAVRSDRMKVIAQLKSAIANGKVNRDDVDTFVSLEFKAIVQHYRFTKDEMVEVIKVAREYEMLNGCYEDFEHDKLKIKEGRRRLEAHFNNPTPHWD